MHLTSGFFSWVTSLTWNRLSFSLTVLNGIASVNLFKVLAPTCKTIKGMELWVFCGVARQLKLADEEHYQQKVLQEKRAAAWKS